MRLNWIASDFEMIVLEGFYDLSKFLETSTRRLDEKHIFQWTNAEGKLGASYPLPLSDPQFARRSTCPGCYLITVHGLGCEAGSAAV